MFEIIHI